MPLEINHTHDPLARSWVASAQHEGTDFPIQNLPFAVFRRSGAGEAWRGGVAIGDQIVDLAALSATGLLSGDAAAAALACNSEALNGFFALGPIAWRSLRHALFALLGEETSPSDRGAVAPCLVAQAEARFKVPVDIGDYSDFYTSLYHAENVSSAAGIQLVTPNFKWMPLVYHGRASSIEVSGHRFRRPAGQTKARDADVPVLRACQRLDYELELAVYVGQGNHSGEPVEIASAESRLFGIGLLNDWSARDIQFWEQAPLGPFLGKNFATTISPWIITMEALAPYRVATSRPAGDPQPLPYLDSEDNRASGAMDITLEVWLGSVRQRSEGKSMTRMSSTSFRHQYWTVAQMVTHHTVNGCNLRIGDVLGSGTVSGPARDEAGALIELAEAGRKPVRLETGELRSFVDDGDMVTLAGHCVGDGFARIGFGQCTAEVLPAAV